jgi:CheY-like chemotaxis protein/curved DNA-binding protein CbpA
MSLKILVVDDRPEDRKTIVSLLRQEEAFSKYVLQVLEAADGAEGLVVFQREQPDLLITDLLMPKTDGFWLCHHVRELPAGRNVPILVMSGIYKDLAVAKQLKDNFNAELLAKPIQTRRFVGKALDALARAASADPAEAAGWNATTSNYQAVPSAAPEIAEVAPIEINVAPPTGAPRLFQTPLAIDFSHPQRGMLNRNPLAWLLVHGAVAQATGTLKLSRGKVRKVVFTVGGQPIYVDSNLRNETLGAYLVSRGVLSEEGLAKAMKQARASGKKLGEALCALGLCGEQTVADGLKGQVRLKLAGALRWPDGAFSWLPGDDFSARVPSSPVDPVELALAALKKLTPVEEVSGELQPLLGQALRLTPIGEPLRDRIEAVFGASVLRQLVSGLSLLQITEGDLDLPTLLVEVHALRVTGLVELCAPSPARRLTPSSGHRAESRPVVGGALEGTAAPSNNPDVIDISTGDGAGSLLELRDLDPTIARTTSAVIELAEIELIEPGGEDPPLHAEPEDSGILTVPSVDDLELESPEGGSAHRAPPVSQPSSESASAPTPEAEAALRELLRNTYEGVHQCDFYQILEVTRDADPAEIHLAYRRSLERFSPESLARTASLDLELSDQLAELSAIVEQAHGVLSDPLRRETYDETLKQAEAQPEPEPDAFGAELFYQDGQSKLREKAFPEAVLEFERATRANPGQPTYHAYLGWALFLARGRGEAGAMAARPHLEEALRIAPDSAQTHELAGHVERDVHNWRAAADHLARALAAGPPRLDLFELVKDVLLRLEVFDELERQYRQLIFRLREKEPLKTIPLWIELAYLYLQRLDQPENARVSVQVAAKLAPGDPRVKAAWAVIGQTQAPVAGTTPAEAAPLDDWREVAEGHRQRFCAESTHPAPLHALAALHHAGGRLDRSLTALSLLAYRGEATSEELGWLAELTRVPSPTGRRPFMASELALLRRDEENTLQLELIACLSPVLAQELPVTLESLGSSEIELLAAIALPSPFREVLQRSCAQLGIPVPPLYLSQTLGEDARPFPCDECAVVVGQGLVDGKDQARVAFLTARALSCLDPGRRHLFSRPVAELKEPVLATISCFRPAVRIDDPHGRVARLKQVVQEHGSPRLAELVGQLVAQKQLNLSEWRRSVRRGSARIALLVAADLRASLDALRDEPEIREDLHRFVLEEKYYELRISLGIASS